MFDDINASFQGAAQAFQSSMSGLGLLLVLAIIVIYMVLGILYESFIHPLTILSALGGVFEHPEYSERNDVWIFGDANVCLLGVTVLTSMDTEDMKAAGYNGDVEGFVAKFGVPTPTPTPTPTAHASYTATPTPSEEFPVPPQHLRIPGPTPLPDAVREAGSEQMVGHRTEDFMELHLNILRGVQARYRTPFFTALKEYSRQPTGVFHAMPISRGKSISRSHWIQDMGAFYGPNIFLAETSATSGGRRRRSSSQKAASDQASGEVPAGT